jgi:hypothetical protein
VHLFSQSQGDPAKAHGGGSPFGGRFFWEKLPYTEEAAPLLFTRQSTLRQGGSFRTFLIE